MTIINMVDKPTLRYADHTCNCGPCIEIPRLYVDGNPIVDLRDHHTCECDPCEANLTALVDTGVIEDLKGDHTCGCDPCEYNQGLLAPYSLALREEIGQEALLAQIGRSAPETG